MICVKCKEAGKLKSKYSHEELLKRDDVLAMLEEFHEECTGCECQHRVTAKHLED